MSAETCDVPTIRELTYHMPEYRFRFCANEKEVNNFFEIWHTWELYQSITPFIDSLGKTRFLVTLKRPNMEVH